MEGRRCGCTLSSGETRTKTNIYVCVCVPVEPAADSSPCKQVQHPGNQRTCLPQFTSQDPKPPRTPHALNKYVYVHKFPISAQKNIYFERCFASPHPWAVATGLQMKPSPHASCWAGVHSVPQRTSKHIHACMRGRTDDDATQLTTRVQFLSGEHSWNVSQAALVRRHA